MNGGAMSENMPSLEEFKTKIESQFGQSLTGAATEAAEDFWQQPGRMGNWFAHADRWLFHLPPGML